MSKVVRQLVVAEADNSALDSDRFHCHTDLEENAVEVNVFHRNIPMDFVRRYGLKITYIYNINIKTNKRRFNQQPVGNLRVRDL